MGNKVLRPSELDPFAAFNDDQISYLQDKFEILCDDHKLLVSEKIADAFKTPQEQAIKILNYIDFEGQGEVDFYEFTCAAASLHQNDDEAE